MGRITGKTLYNMAENMQAQGLDVGISGAYGGWKVTNKAGGKELTSGYDTARRSYDFLCGVSEGATQMQKKQEQGRIDRARELLEKSGLQVEVDPVNPNWNVPAYDARIRYDTEIAKFGVLTVECPSGMRVADFFDHALACFWGEYEHNGLREAMGDLQRLCEQHTQERDAAREAEG